MDEFALIASYFAPLAAGFPGSLKLLDDAALIIPAAGEELVITTDTLVEDVHFKSEEKADITARRALRANLSDLAAKGAKPLCYFLNLSLREVNEPWLEAFTRGLEQDQKEFGIHLAGGDTTRTSGPLTITITALGTVPTGMMLKRSGAKAGDHLYVSGTIGKAVMEKYQPLPEPRLALGQQLRGIATASMDISDGLVQDAGHIARASGVKLVIEAERVPVADSSQLARCLTGGDDYELLFTAPVGHNFPCIGRVEAGNGVELLHQGKEITLEQGGYQHFR